MRGAELAYRYAPGVLINCPAGQENVPLSAVSTLPGVPSVQEPVAHNFVDGVGTTQAGVLVGGLTGGVTTGGGVEGGGAPGLVGAVGTHSAKGAQQAGAATEFQIKEQVCPAGVVPVAGDVGAAPQPGVAGGVTTTGGGAGGGEEGGGTEVGGGDGRFTGSNTLPARPVAPE